MSIIRTYLSSTRISQPASLKGKAVRHLELTSLQRLVPIFLAWKAVLLVAAIASPGHGYDTSTSTLFDSQRGPHNSWFARTAEYVLLRLIRWDAVYFASGSAHGQIYEQEWAFSWLLSKTTSTVARAFLRPLPLSPIAKHSFAGVLISHVSHLLAVVTLYNLIHFITPSTDLRKRQLAFTTACLHVLSPAGIFLSAPYGEATFALASFLGLLCYAHAVSNRFSTFADAYQLDACWILAAGLCFGLATMIRSNGILSGMVFAWDILATIPRLRSILRTRDQEQITRLLSTIAAGMFVAVGLAAPQVLAYIEYCTHGTTRPWCSALPPSIYSFVQSHYWDVGFLRYWKLSNLPLFALAFPVGWLMVETALPALFQAQHVADVLGRDDGEERREMRVDERAQTKAEKVFVHCLPRFALPQLVLVGMAATSFHCQIVNRISSGYVVWYLVLAVEMCVSRDWSDGRDVSSYESTTRNVGGVRDEDGRGGKAMFRLFGNYDRIPSVRPEWVVRGMAVYAFVQAGLYASFLPPA